jgi:hypothetical protein
VGVVVLGLLALGVWRGLSFWHHHRATARTKAAVKVFDGQFHAAVTPLNTVFSQENTVPQSFLVGSVSQTAYVSQTAQWLTTLRAFSSQMAATKPPQPMLKPRAEIVDAANLFIDAVKDFQLAGTTTDGKARTQLVQQGNNTWSHATAVLEAALEDEAIVLHNYRLPLPSGVTPSTLNSPPPTPAEVYNPQGNNLPSSGGP